jgi:protein SPT2
MARGQRAQAVMGQVGKIQHRKSEKRTMERRDDEYAVPNGSGNRPGVKSAPSAYKGNARPGPQRNGAKAPGPINGSRHDRAHAASRPGIDATRPGLGKKPAKGVPPPESERKVKKAAQATTGYTGTARPKPGKFAGKKDNAPRGGALLNGNPRPSSSKHSRYEDDYYDEEMDDFIDYDDEEEEGGPRYGYASDGSSDMEAGLDELDDEERYAERLARKEDIEQERLERSLKVAKEERKRKALEALRVGKRH